MDVSLKNFLTNNLALRSYVFYTSVLSLKMMVMTLLTIRQRFLNNAFVCEEDAKYLGGSVKKSENVERVRRGHRNDMENVYLFLIVGFVYLLTDPDPATANCLFFCFTIARFVHTFVYTVMVVPQPARGLSWLVGYLITGYMAVKTLIHFSN